MLRPRLSGFGAGVQRCCRLCAAHAEGKAGNGLKFGVFHGLGAAFQPGAAGVKLILQV